MAKKKSKVDKRVELFVSDKKKRDFLKLIGGVGIALFTASLFAKKAESFTFGSIPASGVVGLKDASDVRINPATEEKQDDIITGLTAQVGDAYGRDTTGQDAYATILTPSRNCKHIAIILEGANDAIVSIDAGTTDHLYLTANTALAFDDYLISSGVAIQAKNASAGNNYENLTIFIW